MKKIVALLLALMMLMPMVSCGSNPSSSNDNSTSSNDSSTPQNNIQENDESSAAGDTVTAGENLSSVDITLPASFFEGEDMTAFDPDAYAEEQGFEEAVVNDDGSVTITMTEEKQSELTDELNQSVEDSLSVLIQSDETPYITAITHSDSYDKVNITVDPQGYADDVAASIVIPMTVYYLASFYQMYAGEDQHCEITMIDAETGDTIESVVYPDALANVE